MKKRSAMTVAAGLVAALLAGSVALSLGFTGGQTASAGSGHTTPRVRTVERTIKVHKKAKARKPVVMTIAAPASAAQRATASASATSGWSDDESGDGGFESEHESGDDGQFGEQQGDGEDHEDDGGFGDD
jgi:hypothetical protein